LRADGQDQDAPDYNYVGKWAGKDKIAKVDIYVVPTNTGLALEKHSLAYADYYNEPTKATDGTNNVVLTPKKAVKVAHLAGNEVQVYVLLNASEKATAILNDATSANFATEYARVIELSTKEEAVASTKVEENATAAGKIAKKNGTESETIMMTCLTPSPKITLVKGATENEAVAGVKNQAKVSVERTVARVMVSIKAQTFQIKDKLEPAKVLGEIKDLTYVIGQGERQVYIQKQEGTAPNLTWKTPGSAFVPKEGTTDFNTQAAQWYDYSSLWVDYDANKISSGTAIPTITDYKQELGTVTKELETSLSGKFLLPNTHLHGDKGTTEYRKGNTAYILVRGTFVPKQEIFADKGKKYSNGAPVPAYKAGDDFYVGTNGKYYVSMESVRDPQAGGVKGMDANRYVKGKVLYFAWLNPDV
ncbi:Mfa1 family fimbria major subunit, partial [Porphyromonas levii]|uniref:Mfa1 family fimbria major subunit n=1 Tax=Porphyromonas levii TaxID=28114 RepID=UPI001BA444A4